ncbi:MAG: ribosome small subunit-dependent GTPase A, partial [Gaiella sp.]
MFDLITLGWDAERAGQLDQVAAEGQVPGRVAVQHRGAYDVLTALGELRCDVRGRLYDESSSAADLPAVRDW